MMQWGWRVPLLVGCVIIPFLFRLRKSLQETDAFKARKVHPTLSQILTSLTFNWRLVLLGMMLVAMSSVSFYFLTAYTPTFGSLLKLPPFYSFIAPLCIGASNLFWIPVAGAISDRVGRKPLLILSSALMLLTPYASLGWLAGAPSFHRLLIVELWLSCLYGSYNGAMIVFLTEIMPVNVRTTGFSVAYSLATALFGGFTPAISTYLIHVTHNWAIPGAWLSLSAAIGLIATLLASPHVEPTGEATASDELSMVKAPMV
jgi:MFS family permease